MTFFYFIRHGQTLGNTQGISQGTINTEIAYLNEHGKAQAQKLHDHFDVAFADRIIASPLVRTQQTAEIINQTANLPIEFDDRIKEISYGDWDGTKKSELKKDYPDLFSTISGDVVPEYYTTAHGESFPDVENRVAEFVKDMSAKYPDEKLIVVSHGFTIRSAVVNALQVKDPFAVPEPENTSITKISVLDNGQQVLEFFNRVY
ncbi:histidine phosphatase family protein [Paucilactobacillus nenjiangensis]|uniref:Histidine phosphatase family protein n=1 Tax=Paucilactobacillus nenjiangensis TaxID=1296540 RepID=A0A5P1WZ39_9LACO|nr:histidine phosphatase family protein [Paucilactobacillus nenjiangensis]QER66493.1 histidine phosphatase family protein [Paucilactobacillus nenjiangensis]